MGLSAHYELRRRVLTRGAGLVPPHRNLVNAQSTASLGCLNRPPVDGLDRAAMQNLKRG